MEIPLGHPEGVLPPPITLPGKSSIPVSRQLIPRMWLSPSPFTLLCRSRSTNILSWKGSKGFRILLCSKSSPILSGQNSSEMVPFGLNITTSRCLSGTLEFASAKRFGDWERIGRDREDKPSCFSAVRRSIKFNIT